MPTIWTKATQEVLDLAQDLIDEHHSDLADAAIGIVFRDTAPVSNGKMTLGQASKVTPRMRPYLDLDFMIWLAQDFWIEASSLQRRALMDHELCHCEIFDGEIRMRPHDVEEFEQIIERYGYWKSDLISARQVFEKALQYELPGLSVLEHARNLKKLGGRLVAMDPELIKG